MTTALASVTSFVLLLTVLAVLAIDFFEHIRRGKAALLSDALLIAILTGGMLYLLLHNVSLTPPVPWAIVATALVESPEVSGKIRNLGCDPLPMSVREFEAMISTELTENAALIKKAGIKAN